MSESYSFEDFNRYGVLKGGIVLLLILMLLTMHYWIGLATLMSRSTQLMASVFDGTQKYHLIAEFPALLVALAAVLRKPDTGRWARVIWRFGAPLLVVSAIGAAALRLAGATFQFRFSALESLDLAVLGAILVAAGYVVFAPRARQVFKEFPVPLSENKS